MPRKTPSIRWSAELRGFSGRFVDDVLDRRTASYVRVEEMLSAFAVRVRSSVKRARDTDWTVNISLRWQSSRLPTCLASRGIGKASLRIHFSAPRVSRVMYV